VGSIYFRINRMHLGAASSDVKELYLLKLRVTLNVRVKTSNGQASTQGRLKREKLSQGRSQRPSVALNFAISASS
jgi:hypothetical protein